MSVAQRCAEKGSGQPNKLQRCERGAAASQSRTESSLLASCLFVFCLVATALLRSVPIILSLLSHKADINLANSAGSSPIQVALQSGWQDTAAFLFEQGAAFDAAARTNTKITCPDCKRVDAGWAAAGYDRAKIPNYEYANKQWNRKAGAGGK